MIPERIIRVFPRRTSHMPDDDMAFVDDDRIYRVKAAADLTVIEVSEMTEEGKP
jgi:hypothetical protein